jgi:flavin-dependent dehydrogenase
VGCDAVIEVGVVGGGPAGLTVARLLALRGRRVTVIDPLIRRCDRLEMLPPSSGELLAALGLTDLLRDPSVSLPCAGIRRRWASQEIEYEDFFHRPGGQGVIVDRSAFDALLRTLCVEVGVTIIPGRVTGARRTTFGFELDVAVAAGKTRVRAGTAIDAAGRPAVLARRLGASRTIFERLVAERCAVGVRQDSSPIWLDVEASHGAWSYVVVGPGGRAETWAVSRAPGRRCTLNTVVNASSACLSPAAGRGWIAIGDSASAFDPITSQGLANALGSALAAAGAILSAGGIDDIVASAYSDLVLATFVHSESGRRAVYGSMSAL